MFPTGADLMKDITLLYVEDEDIARMSIGAFLGRYTGKLMTATNGQEGFELYKQHKPAVVVTDLEMPIMGGLEMIRKIRELDDSVPIIITTAYDDESHTCPAADMRILKPISFMELLKGIQDCLETRQE